MLITFFVQFFFICRGAASIAALRVNLRNAPRM